MAFSSQNQDSESSNKTGSNHEIIQMEAELSSLSFLLSELRTQEASHLNGTSAEQGSNHAQGNEVEVEVSDSEVQALLEKLEQLHGFADNVDDRMDTLLAKLDGMLGALDVSEEGEELEGEVKQSDGSPEKADAGQETDAPTNNTIELRVA